MFIDSPRTAGRLRLGLVLAVPALLATACGGSSGSAGTQGSGTQSTGASTKAAGATSQVAEVGTHSGALGTFLTDASGRTLYLFAADHGDTSTCTGGCVSAWPPLMTTGSPTPTGQVKANLLGTLGSGGGRRQVTYNGHPLYYFAGDTSSGETKGEGVNGFGAKWWVVSPAGTALTQGSGGATSGSSGSGYGSGGGGYG